MHLVGAGLNQTIKEGAILEIVKAIRFVDEVIPYKAVDEIEKANKRDVGYYGHR